MRVIRATPPLWAETSLCWRSVRATVAQMYGTCNLIGYGQRCCGYRVFLRRSEQFRLRARAHIWWIGSPPRGFEDLAAARR